MHLLEPVRALLHLLTAAVLTQDMNFDILLPAAWAVILTLFLYADLRCTQC